MPGFNGTGPLGQGPLTGKGRGYCSTYRGPREDNIYGGAGYGHRNFGSRGRCNRNRFFAPGLANWKRRAKSFLGFANFQLDGDRKLETLQEQVKYHENTLTELQEEIKKLEASTD